MASRRPRLAQRLTAALLSGPDAPFILDDLAQAYERDLAQGLTPGAARRRYWRNAFGSVLSTWRAVGWSGWGVSRIDLKLACRTLVKQPGLTAVAVFALSIGIPVGLAPLHLLDATTAPLPVPEGARLVMVRNWDLHQSRAVDRPIHDYAEWRGNLASFEDLGLARTAFYNFISEDGRAAPVRGAQVTASVFTLLRVPPLLGRTLDPADEVEGAAPVVVISHDIWQLRLAGAGNVVGSEVRIGGDPYTVVGVMPEGFLFPRRDHLWFPLRANPLDHARGEGPDGWIIARLVDGITIEEARTEVELMGQRMAAQFPKTHGRLQAQVLPYTDARLAISDSGQWEFLVMEFASLLVLMLACGNVGILILARSAARTSELAVRSALGASRKRIIGQLLIESLLLALVAAGAGLGLGQLVANQFAQVDALPYWLDFGITTKTALTALSLAVLSAVIAGGLPAIKVTGKSLGASVHRALGEPSGMRFGKLSSLLIIGEVAVAVWFLAIGGTMAPAVWSDPDALGLDANQYLYAQLRLPWIDTGRTARQLPGTGSDGNQVESGALMANQLALVNRAKVVHRELARRLAAEPGVGDAAIASALPGTQHSVRFIEIEGDDSGGIQGNRHRVQQALVAPGFFAALGKPILNGRTFTPGDNNVCLVNTSFVEQILGGRNPIGLRIRHLNRGSSWMEIVGVVGRLGMNAVNPTNDAGLYLPGEAFHPVRFALRVGDDPEAFIPRLREIAASIDPTAMIQEPSSLGDVFHAQRYLTRWLVLLFALLAGIAVTLSAAGLYALMSFTVSERTREIGIRAALGAQRSSIVGAIVRRALLQLGTGVTLGVVLCAVSFTGAADDMFWSTSQWPWLAAGVSLFVIGVGLLACVSPTRRGLGIQPSEALKAG